MDERAPFRRGARFAPGLVFLGLSFRKLYLVQQLLLALIVVPWVASLLY
jgi:hypothetical protein